MIVKSLLVLLPSLLIGFISVSLLWPTHFHKHLHLKVFLGTGAGLGTTSCLYFVWCLIFNPTQKGFLFVELAVTIFLLAALVVRIKNDRHQINSNNIPTHNAYWLSFPLGLAALLCLGLIIISYKNYVLMFPHGTFDAYAIWNLKARFMFRNSQQWMEAFSPLLNWKFHPDYPLLIPVNITRVWTALGLETTRAPIVHTGLFAFSTAGLIFSTLSITRSYTQGALGVLLLLATPWFIFYATTLNAAHPLAYYYLAALVPLTLYPIHKSPQLLFLSGLMAGFAAWVKNEGLVFLIAVIVIIPLTSGKTSMKERLSQYKPFMLGLILPILAVLYFKLCLAPQNDILAAQSLQTIIARIIDPSRHLLIIREFSNLFLLLGKWRTPVFPIIIFYLLFMQQARTNLTIKWIKILVPGILLTFLGYYIIYLITPHPLEWHLQYSADRLLFHIFPLILFAIFLISKTPDEIVLPAPERNQNGPS